MRRKRLLWQLFPPYLLLTLLCLLLVSWYATRSLREFYLEQIRTDLQAKAFLLHEQVGEQVATGQASALQALCRRFGELTQTRITVIDPAGVVLGDTREDPVRMDNHADRPEVSEALAGHSGYSTRFSNTLQEDMMYVSIPILLDGNVRAVLRTSLSLATINQSLRTVYQDIFLGGLVLALLAAAVSYFMARRLSRPLQELQVGAERFAGGDLEHKMRVPDSEEFGALAEAMNKMAAHLDDRIQAVVRQRQELEAVLASMVEGVLAIDADERIISLNQAAADLLETDYEESLGMSMQEVVRNADLLMLIKAALSGDKPVEGDVQLYSEHELFLQAHAASLHGSEGQKIGALVVLHDVTRLRRLENLRRDFVANVSHELKTPITSIKGFVETLLDGAMDHPEDARRFLKIIATQANRLGAIVEDLLSLSRLEMEPERADIALLIGRVTDVLHNAAQACIDKAAAKSIKIDIDCPEDLQAKYTGLLLEQAVVNLIDNAIKYSDPGDTVVVRGLARESTVEIRVQDHGSGIDPDHLPRLFERFYRIDKARSRKLGGTGLGLAIVKHIAQAHGGEVGVESQLGAGSTFWLRIPLR